MPVRFTSPSLGGQRQSFLSSGEWQVGAAYRHLGAEPVVRRHPGERVRCAQRQAALPRHQFAGLQPGVRTLRPRWPHVNRAVLPRNPLAVLRRFAATQGEGGRPGRHQPGRQRLAPRSWESRARKHLARARVESADREQQGDRSFLEQGWLRHRATGGPVDSTGGRWLGHLAAAPGFPPNGRARAGISAGLLSPESARDDERFVSLRWRRALRAGRLYGPRRLGLCAGPFARSIAEPGRPVGRDTPA